MRAPEFTKHINKSRIFENTSQLPPNVIELIKKIAQSTAAPEHKKAMIDSLITKYRDKQGVAEDTTPDDEKAIEIFAQIVADDTGYDVERVNYYTYDEGLRTPSGIPVYYYSFDGDVRYVGALPGGKPTAIVNQDGEVGSRGSHLELSIGGQVEYVIKGKTLFSAADQQKIANAKPGDDEYSLVLIALDLMWGRMQHKFMEQDVSEGAEDSDRQALVVADKLTTDKNLAKLNDMAHDSTIYRALERYFAKNNISTTIFNRVAAIVFKKLDKYGRRLSTDPRIQEQGVAEATGDPKFDKMLKGITGKRQVAKQQKADTKQQARDAFGGMFGGGNPADKLSIRKKGVAEGLPPMGFVRSEIKRDPLKNPTRTYIEISKMLGIASRQLQGLVRSFPGFPAPIKEIGRQARRGTHNYYELNQVKQWIKNNNLKDTIAAIANKNIAKDQGMTEDSDDFEVRLDGKTVPGPFNDFDHARNKASKLISYQKGEVAEVYVNGKLKMRLKLNTPHQHFDEHTAA